jgi:hypothetical protein
VGFDFQSPAAMPSNAEKAGDFSEDCLRAASPSSAAARLFEQRREAEGHGRGCSFLWLLSFEQAKESDSPRGEKEWFKYRHCPSPASGRGDKNWITAYAVMFD